jgi:hypothetical protein
MPVKVGGNLKYAWWSLGQWRAFGGGLEVCWWWLSHGRRRSFGEGRRPSFGGVAAAAARVGDGVAAAVARVGDGVGVLITPVGVSLSLLINGAHVGVVGGISDVLVKVHANLCLD